jgi:hypothetical protein
MKENAAGLSSQRGVPQVRHQRRDVLQVALALLEALLLSKWDGAIYLLGSVDN